METQTSINFGKLAQEQKTEGRRKKLVQEQEKIKKARARNVFYLKLKLLSLTLLISTIAVSVYWFTDNYKLRNPVLLSFQAPYSERKAEKIMVPVVMGEEVESGQDATTDEQKRAYIRNSKYPVILAGVWFRESTNGQNTSGHHNYCAEVGYSNEYGFGVYGDNKKCFSSFEKATDAVEGWFDEHLKSLTVDEALCLYNTGTASDDCNYAHEFRADENKVWSELIK